MNKAVRRLVVFLEKFKEGEKISYKQLLARTGCDAQDPKCTYTLYSAYRHLAEKKMIFGAVRGVGIQRMANPDILTKATQQIVRAENTIKKAQNMLDAIPAQSLSKEDRVQYHTVRTLAKTAGYVMSTSISVKIGRRVAKLGIEMDLTTAIREISAISQVQSLNIFGVATATA